MMGSMDRVEWAFTFFSSPVGTPGVKGREIRPPYPQRVVKGDLMGRRYIALDADTALNNNLT